MNEKKKNQYLLRSSPTYKYKSIQQVYIDESQLFKDEEIKKNNRQIQFSGFEKIIGNITNNRSIDQKNSTIIKIYNKIAHNNANDPLYAHVKRQKQKQRNKSMITSSRNSRLQNQNANNEKNKIKDDRKYHKMKLLSKFMGEINSSITHEKQKQQNIQVDIHRSQKISLLKRIIEHYNLKSVQRKYYSNLIKTFGMKIQSVNSNQMVMKKNLHPRETYNIGSGNAKHVIVRQNTQPIQPMNQQRKQTIQQNNQQGKRKKQLELTNIGRKSIFKKIKQSNSFILPKQLQLNGSRQNLSTSFHKNSVNMNVQYESKLKGQISQKMRKSIQYSQKLIQRPIKMQITTSYQEKINKYRQFLFVLNLSNGIYKNLDTEKYQKSFKYYVGKGNNGNLIKSLMKKRFWFQVTQDYKEADFVWTQLKIEEVFQKQSSGLKKQQIQQKQVQTLQEYIQCFQKNSIQNPKNVLIFNQTKTEQNPFQSIKNQIKKQKEQKFCTLKQIKFIKNKSKAKDYAPNDPLQKILTLNDLKFYRNINQALNFKKFPNFADKMKVSMKKLHIQSNFPNIQNHLPLNGLLGNKKALFYNLKQYCKLTNKKLSDYVPMTFHIKKGLIDPQYKSLAGLFMQRKKQKLPNYWIMKPGQYSNRGQGITCTNKLEQIRQRVNKCRQLSRNGKQSSLIVQLYISNPLLYNGRKFDIRVFMMITIVNGKIKGYWYQQGYVRTSSFLWSLFQIEDKYIHLTNDAIQKTCDQYGLYQPGNKLTFGDLQRYLHTLPKLGKNADFFQLIYPQMRSIATDVIKCACLNLDPKRLRDNFEVFGLDFMIDQNLKTYLIQVNTNPCLELNCPILQRILPHMVENSLRIALDPLFPPPSNINSEYKYSIPQNALHYNKFQLVFDQDRDGDQLKKLYKYSQILQQIDDFQEDQQQYQADGEILQINND